jgi:hypothetical protein
MLTTASIEWGVAALLGLSGASHILHPRLWTEFFRDLFTRAYAGFVIGVPTLLAGLATAAAHPDWEWQPGTVATAIGWSWSIKGGLYLVAPGLPQRLARGHLEHPRRFAAAGVVLLFLAAVLVFGRLNPPGGL